jgi:nucleolar GTP-binding protein
MDSFFINIFFSSRKQKQKAEKKMENDEDVEDEEEMESVPPKFKTERQIELEQGDEYILDLKKKYLLPEDQKYDIIPETWNGHNIADYIDPDIMAKLDALEKEEEARERAGFYDSEESEEDESYEEIRQLAGRIRAKKAVMKADQLIDGTRNKPVIPRNTVAKKRERSVSRLKKEFETLGVDMEGTENTHFQRSARSTSRRPAKRAKGEDGESRHRSLSKVTPRDQSGVKDAKQGTKLKKMAKKMQRKTFAVRGKAGESDRKIQEKKPKHLFAGKRGNGKTDRR